jgi:D-alanyl-D-alanine dipeptidase
LPSGFVYLSEIEATIIQDIRYAGSHNFIGRPARGYEAPACILSLRTAEALKRIQNQLRAENLSLMVYDCYRPERAVQDFAEWAEAESDQIMKNEFYPEVDKSRLFSLGYLAKQSSHSRGNAVDLKIVRMGENQIEHKVGNPLRPCHLPKGVQEQGSDYGTDYDCFHELSRTHHPAIRGEAQKNRDRLVAQMRAQGFVNYEREWWHFELPGAGSDARDFPIRDSPSSVGRASVRETEQTLEERLRTGCGETVRIVCVSGGARVRAYEEPKISSKVAGTLREGDLGITCIKCEGSPHTLESFTRLGARARSRETPPWCLVKFFASGALTRMGWISAKHIAPASQQVQCGGQ